MTHGCPSAICERFSTFHNDANGASVEPSLNFIGLVGTPSPSRVSGGVSKCHRCPSETGVELGNTLTFSRESHLLEAAVDRAAVRSVLQIGAVVPVFRCVAVVTEGAVSYRTALLVMARPHVGRQL